MRFDILTIFPEFFKSFVNTSIIGKAVKNSIIEINTVDIRDFSLNKHKKVDDYPYGGGAGMVMTPEPVYYAYQSIVKDLSEKPKVVYLTPQGKQFDQETAKNLSNENHLILLCGHYEGIDERVIEEIVDYEISIGDYVLTGGEIPAMVVIDSISRMIKGVLSSEESYSNESHYNGLLEYPQYTRPYEFLGKKVPEILLSGHHKKIEQWRKEQSVKRTRLKRPDLLK